ncbi:MAG: haloalkane dehalogenase, partial [Pseudomonadota bacterium]
MIRTGFTPRLLSAGLGVLLLAALLPGGAFGTDVPPKASLFPVPGPEPISADFPFEKKTIEVLGTEIAYVDEGEGQAILFLHGNPTSSYLWRNILPYLTDRGRVIAPDNVGFGASGKPDIDYTFATHADYLAAFIDALDLQSIILVTHDWGGALGLDYAARNPDQVKAIAFMETFLPPGSPIASLEAMGTAGELFRIFRHAKKGPAFIIDKNGFIEEVFPAAIIRTMTEEEMNAYRAPFIEPASRKPLYVWPNQVPIAGKPEDVVERVSAYSDWLFETETPKLHVYVSPGI